MFRVNQDYGVGRLLISGCTAEGSAAVSILFELSCVNWRLSYYFSYRIKTWSQKSQVIILLLFYLRNWETDLFPCLFVFFKILFICRERRGEGGGEREREREKHWFDCLSHAPNQGPGPQPGQVVPWPGSKPGDLQFAAQHPAHWATPGEPGLLLLNFSALRSCKLTIELSLWTQVTILSIIGIYLMSFILLVPKIIFGTYF